MPRGMIFSGLLHATVILVAIFGLPFVTRLHPEPPQPIAVEVVTIDKISNPKKGREQVEKSKKPTEKVAESRKVATKPEPKPEPKEEPKPEPKVAEAPKPEPKPEPKHEPKPQPPKVAEVPPPKPEPKPEPKPTPPKIAELPKPEPKPEPKPKEEPKVAALPPAAEKTPKTKRSNDLQPRVKAKPKPKPAAPKRPRKRMSLASILDSVKNLKRETRTAPRETQANNPQRGSPKHNPNLRLSMSELDALRQQIRQCWNFPAGAKNRDELIVMIKLEINRDRTVKNAEIVDRARMYRDPFFRSAAESALRAVLNPRCSPLRLPPDKYELWHSITLRFNPKEMLGG